MGMARCDHTHLMYSVRMLYMWAPLGRKKQLPGLSSWKKNSSWSLGEERGVGGGGVGGEGDRRREREGKRGKRERRRDGKRERGEGERRREGEE